MSEVDEVLAYLSSNRKCALLTGWLEKQPIDKRSIFNRKWRR